MEDFLKANILIVDDKRQNIALLEAMLEEEGYSNILGINDPRDVTGVYQGFKPDIILLDINMPYLDGFQVMKQLKELEKDSYIPVLVLTALQEKEIKLKALESGAKDFLSKPFDRTEVLSRIYNVLEVRMLHNKVRSQKEILEKQNEALIEAAKLRDDIDNIVRHDLKTPLNTIIAYPQVLLMKEYLKEKDKHFIRIISEAGYRMLNMINLSLDMFKMERGEYQLNPTPVNVLKVLKTIELEVENTRKTKDLTIKTEISGRLLDKEDIFTIFGEELLCYSMLANLVKNAIEASPQGERISINVDKQEMSLISIHNKGTVPEEIRDKFFVKYATSGKTTGTGLGTYSAKLIAETQRGQINMVTSETEGTTITIKLPDK